MACEFISPVTFHDIFTCYAGTLFNNDYFLLGACVLMGFALIAYYVRLPFALALPLAFVGVYMIDLISGGTTYLLQVAMVLLGIGMGITIIYGLMNYAKDYS